MTLNAFAENSLVRSFYNRLGYEEDIIKYKVTDLLWLSMAIASAAKLNHCSGNVPFCPVDAIIRNR